MLAFGGALQAVMLLSATVLMATSATAFVLMRQPREPQSPQQPETT
jgi:hypothetical protein